MLPVNDFYPRIEILSSDMRLSASWSNVYMLSSSPQIEPGAPVRSVFKDISLEGIVGLRINLKEERVTPSIRQLYDMVKALKEEDALTMLNQHIGASEAIDAIKRLEFLDLRKLISMVIWLTTVLKFRVSSIDLVEDLETRQPQFVGVYIEDCDWDDWKILSRAIKKQLNSEGFEDIARQVALICKQALKIRRD